MSMAATISDLDGNAPLRRAVGAAAIDFAIPTFVVGIAVAAASASLYLAIGLAFAMTVVVALLMPRAVPFLLLFAFLFQNWFIAASASWVTDLALFDAMRAINFVVLMAAYGCFTLAVLLNRTLVPPQVLRWIIGGWIVVGLIVLYVGLGAVRGSPRDAILYLRNILTPIACFQIALICGARFRHNLVPAVTIATLIIIAYGYGELLFTTDFLALFGGDKYIALRMKDDILHGIYDRMLADTGFVLRGIEDFMTVPLFNITGSSDDAIRIFRLSGPNFHPISYGYALAILTAWLFVHRVRWVVLLALPVMIAVGSKGALAVLTMVLLSLLVVRVFKPASARLVIVSILLLYLAGTLVLGLRGGDYHVLGLISGLREFVTGPWGHGIGEGGVTSSIGLSIDWESAQENGFTSIPVESTVGVLLYQMGVAAFAVFALVLAIGHRSWKAFTIYRRPEFLFGAVATWTITVNAFFQEEAYFAPLALGTALILIGTTLGAHLAEEPHEDPLHHRVA